MAIGITEEHDALRQAVRRFVDARIPASVPRAVVDGTSESRPEFWAAIREPGWLGLHISEAHGGAGYGLVEQAVVIEELGRACAPGPYLATVLAAAILQEAGGAAADALLAKLVSGECTGALALAGARPVLGGEDADVVVCEIGGTWAALDAAAVKATAVASIDLTRPVAELDLDGVVVPADRQLRGLTSDRVRDLAAVLLAAEAIGVAQWCVETAAEYAKVRVQFGRPIGQFQGVKHRCADMLARTELARRRGVGRGPRRERPRQRRRARDCGRRGARVRRGIPQRQGLRADARGNRLHVGTRCAPLSPARDHAAPAGGHTRRMAGARPRARCRVVPGAGSRSTSAPKRRRTARRCEHSWRRSRRWRPPPSASGSRPTAT